MTSATRVQRLDYLLIGGGLASTTAVRLPETCCLAHHTVPLVTLAPELR